MAIWRITVSISNLLTCGVFLAGVVTSFLSCAVCDNADSVWSWRSIDDTVSEPLDLSTLKLHIIPNFDLCLTGEVMWCFEWTLLCQSFFSILSHRFAQICKLALITGSVSICIAGVFLTYVDVGRLSATCRQLTVIWQGCFCQTQGFLPELRQSRR